MTPSQARSSGAKAKRAPVVAGAPEVVAVSFGSAAVTSIEGVILGVRVGGLPTPNAAWPLRSSLLRVEQPALVDFDHYSDDYREAVEGANLVSRTDLDFFVRAKAEVLLELASAVVGPPAELGFLDVGCGPGETDGFLEGRVGRLAGVDVAPRMIAEARRRLPWAEYRDYEAGERFPWEDSSFDVCFAVCVFHHVERPRRPGCCARWPGSPAPAG